MGFYNFSYIIRNILYNFRKSLKYIVLILLIIFIFYVLLSPKVKAVSNVPDVVISSATSYFENSGYTDFFLCEEDGNYRLILFNNISDNYFYYSYWYGAEKWWVRCTKETDNIVCKLYTISSNGTVSFQSNSTFGAGNGHPAITPNSFILGTCDVYSDSNLSTKVFEANYNTFKEPFLYNENGYSYLQLNTFNDFVIFPGDTNTTVVDFVLQNITDNWSFLDSPQIKITLDSYSKYWTNTSEGYCWVIPKKT